jgi:HAD superfamily hydrolase (TIGR01509 family)
MTVAAVVFDMDGLMLDTEPLYKQSWQAASAELGFPIDDRVYATFVGRPNKECERDLVERFGPAFPLERFRARWQQTWQERAASHGIALKPGLLEVISFLQDRGVPHAVATSSTADEAALALRHARLDGRFDIIVTGDQVARGKPAPDIYLEAARRLDVDPAACVALEDSEAGTLAASAAGMRTLLIPDGARPTATAVHAAFRVLRSLHDAPGVFAELL